MLLVLASLSDAQAFQWQNHSHAQSQNQGAPVTVSVADLPAQARAMLLAIKQGGPFAYDRDGVVFGNFERALPKQARGYYREYTVKTPGVRSRGARRIISGSGGEYYYTDEHYQTFKRIRE
jgi:ribonuclease T1